jgi:hypothetical protein
MFCVGEFECDVRWNVRTEYILSVQRLAASQRRDTNSSSLFLYSMYEESV